MTTKLFFERQGRLLCRFCSVNNYLQKKYVTATNIDMHFEQFKKIHSFAVKELTHNENGENFITYLLELFSNRKHRVVDKNMKTYLLDHSRVPSFVCYNKTHCFVVLKSGAKFYRLDSLRMAPEEISISIAYDIFKKLHCIIS